jgi:molybdopterin converting factor small subunit
MPTVQIPSPLRHLTEGHDAIEASGKTVGEVLKDASSRFPGLGDRLFEGPELRRFVNVYVNNEDIRYLEDLETSVSEADEVSIIPAIAGG